MIINELEERVGNELVPTGNTTQCYYNGATHPATKSVEAMIRRIHSLVNRRDDEEDEGGVANIQDKPNC